MISGGQRVDRIRHQLELMAEMDADELVDNLRLEAVDLMRTFPLRVREYLYDEFGYKLSTGAIIRLLSEIHTEGLPWSPDVEVEDGEEDAQEDM